MKNKKFFNIQQASQYLRHSIISIDGVPVYIYDVMGERNDIKLSYSPLDKVNLNAQQIKVDDKRVDMNPVQLGMCSMFDGNVYQTFYVSRMPARKWKIGLAKENVVISYLLGQGNAGRDYLAAIFPSSNLSDCIKGKYMSFEEAKDVLHKWGGTVPISRHFAINSNGQLMYKAAPDVVGAWTKRGGIKLSDDFLFLSEMLQEDMHE